MKLTACRDGALLTADSLSVNTRTVETKPVRDREPSRNFVRGAYVSPSD